MKKVVKSATVAWCTIEISTNNFFQDISMALWYSVYILPVWIRFLLYSILATTLFVSLVSWGAIVVQWVDFMSYTHEIFLEPYVISPLKNLFLKVSTSLISPILTLIKRFGVELVVILSVSELKAWFAKKGVRVLGRFAVTIAAKKCCVTIVNSLVSGRRRKLIKKIPSVMLYRLERSYVGRAIRWWKGASERSKRITSGIVLSAICIILGYYKAALIVVLSDLIWEIILWIWRRFMLFWKLASSFLTRFIQNFILSNFGKALLSICTLVSRILRIRWLIDSITWLFHKKRLPKPYRWLKSRLILHVRLRKPAIKRSIQKIVPDSVQYRSQRFLENVEETDRQSLEERSLKLRAREDKRRLISDKLRGRAKNSS